MRETIWRHQLYRDGRFEPLANSGRSLTWAYKLKALKSSLGAFTYVITEGGGGFSKMLMHGYGGGGGSCTNDDISKNNFVSQSEVVLKQKTASNYLLYIFVIITASINFYGFPLDLPPVVLLNLICFFISGASLICTNVNNF